MVILVNWFDGCKVLLIEQLSRRKREVERVERVERFLGVTSNSHIFLCIARVGLREVFAKNDCKEKTTH